MKIFFTIVKRTMALALIISLLLTITVVFYIRQTKFGKAPSGTRLERLTWNIHAYAFGAPRTIRCPHSSQSNVI